MVYTAPTLLDGNPYPAATWQAALDEVARLSAASANPPRYQGRQITTQQTISNLTSTPLTFNAEDVDSANGHSTTVTPSRYVAQLAGWYLLSGKAAWVGNVTGSRRNSWLKNGAVIPGSQISMDVDSTAVAEHNAVTMQVQLAVGDYVELQVFQDSGADLLTDVSNAGQSFMSALWVAS